MTYFSVLAVFLLSPLALLTAVVGGDIWRRALGGQDKVDRRPYAAIGLHVLLAVAYTTPWDNYLVANRVWWYDENLVTGITLGWVPIEEYTFFVLQTLLTGLWVVGLLRKPLQTEADIEDRPRLRRLSLAVLGVVWLVSTAVLLSGWPPGRYMSLILSWALLPVIVQAAYGADILRAHARRVLWGIAAPTIYLWVVDFIAIRSGTWTIDPAQTTGLKLGVLPIEEMLFFLMTNILISFGVTLLLSPASQTRLQAWLGRWRGVDARDKRAA